MNKTTKHLLSPYAPPQMTIVPIRASGAMLVGSVQMQSFLEMDLRDNFQASYDYDEGFSTDPLTTASGWGNTFFD